MALAPTTVEKSGDSIIEVATSIPNGLTVGAMLNFLQSNGASKILSSPKLLCLDNQESSIYVGQVAPFQTAAAVNTSTTTQGATYSYKDVGLTLTITPQIMDDNKVRLDIKNKLEDIIATGEDGTLPTTTKREVTSTSIVNNGDEIVIAGLLKDKISKNVSKVPLLGDLPFLGALFRNTSTGVERVNLVIILKPTIIKDANELQEKSNMIESRLISKKEKDAIDKLQIINNEDEIIEDKTQNNVEHENRLKSMGIQ